MVNDVMKWAHPLITIAERIKKVMQDKQDKRLLQQIGNTDNNMLLQQVEMRDRGRGGAASGFPIILEKEVEAYNTRKRAEKK